MKHCPKCSRTFPDESQKFCTVDGGILIGEPTVDPNATIRVNPADLEMLMPQTRRDKVAKPGQPPEIQKPPETQKVPEVSKPPDMGATLYAPAGGPPPNVAPPQPPPKPVSNSAPAVSPAGTERPQPLPGRAPAIPSAAVPIPAKKRSWLPWILGILLLLLLLGFSGLAALVYFLKPRVDEFLQRSAVTGQERTGATAKNNRTESNTTSTNSAATATFVPPAGAIKFANSRARLDGKLAAHYIGFSFYYPQSWQSDTSAGVAGSSNFVKIERRLPPDFTQENFAVGWYSSGGTFETDEPTFPQLVEFLGSTLSKSFPEYRKVSEGPTTVNSLPGYEFRFVSSSKGTEKGDIDVWGRVIFLPTGIKGKDTGATLIMLATSLAPELSGVEDVGAKGETPVVLDSFRFNDN